MKVLHSYPNKPEKLSVGSEFDEFRQYFAALLLGLSEKIQPDRPRTKFLSMKKKILKRCEIRTIMKRSSDEIMNTEPFRLFKFKVQLLA